MNATRIKWQLPHFANLLAALISFLPRLQAQIAVPPLVTYHGRLSASGTNYVGTGYFKFAIVNGGTNLNRSAGGYCVTAGGGVSSAVVTDGGSGYTVVPQVTILAPPRISRCWGYGHCHDGGWRGHQRDHSNSR